MSRNGGRGKNLVWEGVWPYLDPMDGQRVFAHSVHGVECVREVRSARRALFSY